MFTNNKEKRLNKCAKSFFPNKFINIKNDNPVFLQVWERKLLVEYNSARYF